MNNQISVIVPCFNNEKTINRAIQSILNQSVKPKEIIIVDDKSKDKTIENVKKIQEENNSQKITLIELKENYGAANARNIGWDHAKTNYIAFLDADDTWHHRKIELQLSFMLNNPHADLSGHAMELYSEKKIINHKEVFFRKISKTHLLLKNKFPTPSVMLKRSIPIRFKKNQRYSEDYLLWLQIIHNNYQCYFCSQILAFVHKPFYGSGGLSANLSEMQKHEIGNYKSLLNEKFISTPTFILASTLSYLKYTKRLILNSTK